MSDRAGRFHARRRKLLIALDPHVAPTAGMAVAASCGVLQTNTSQTFGTAVVEPQRAEIRMVLITGSNIGAMEQAALALFRAGQVPVLGEWIASPLAADEHSFEEVYPPLIERLVERCDALLRLPGTSADSDALVSVARSRGLRVYFTLSDALAG
jgi:hypothetical protein